MDSSLLLTMLILAALFVITTKIQSADPGTPWSWESILHAIRTGFGATESPSPRSPDYYAANLPDSWPIRTSLITASEELQAMRRTLTSAHAVRLPGHLIHSYDQNMKQAARLLNRNGERVVQAARTGPVSPQLDEALTRKQRGIERLLEALQLARGSLAAVIVTGLEDQRDLDRVTVSLEAWSEALSEISTDTARDRLPTSIGDGRA